MQTTIQPVTIYPHQVVALRIDAVKVQNLGDAGSAVILCTYLSEEDKSIQTHIVKMTSEAYCEWGYDDAYVLNYALKELGLTKA